MSTADDLVKEMHVSETYRLKSLHLEKELAELKAENTRLDEHKVWLHKELAEVRASAVRMEAALKNIADNEAHEKCYKAEDVKYVFADKYHRFRTIAKEALSSSTTQALEVVRVVAETIDFVLNRKKGISGIAGCAKSSEEFLEEARQRIKEEFGV